MHINTENILSELNCAVGQIFQLIIKIELSRDRACILSSMEQPGSVAMEVCWTEYWDWYTSAMVAGDRDAARNAFSCERLQERYRAGENFYVMDCAIQQDEGVKHWNNIQVSLCTDAQKNVCAYLMVRKTEEAHLLRSVISQYAYADCDCFIYLDAKNNSYTMFSGSTAGSSLPSAHCDDYASELVRYANEFVVPEDRELVIREMNISRVLEVLSQKPTHSFCCGIMDPDLGYTKKRLDYRFHDRERQTLLLSRTDITELYRQEQEHRRELQEALTRAQTDSLTGLLNYQSTVDKITDYLACQERSCALMFIDLDNFKGINDTLGHSTGDELLRQIARILRTNTRDIDLVGRVGGDEFVVFLRWVRSRNDVEAHAQRLCDSIRGLPFQNQQGISVSCSIGIALAPKDGMDYETLVKKADRRVYRAKRDGKGCYSI